MPEPTPVKEQPVAFPNHIIFASSAELMRKHGAPTYMVTRMTSLAEISRTDPATARRVIPQILENLPNEKAIR